MFHIRVSRDQGESYQLEKSADTIEELHPLMEKLNNEEFRWYIENEKREIVPGKRIYTYCEAFK